MQISDTSPKLWLQYSSNNDFFPESIEFLQKIWFVNILCIDMYVKYSFQKMSRATLVQGAEIDTYDNDHMINDTFFVHKITIPRETSITRALVYIKLNQKKSMSAQDIISFVKSIPMVSLLLFWFLSFLIPWTVGKVLQFVNLIAFLIFLLYFAYKFIRHLLTLTSNKNTAVQDHSVTYINPYDLKIFTKEVKQKIEELKDSGVTDIAIDRNNLYFKQDLIDTTDRTVVWELLGQIKPFDEERKRKTMEKMIEIFWNPDFLALFKEENAN